MTYSVLPKSGNVTIIRVEYDGILNQDFLLTADRHWDNPDSKWKMQRKHLKEARIRGAGVLDFGDFFCAMQGKYDKRSNKEHVRRIHQKDDYLDSLVTTASDWFLEDADLFIRIARGNHDTSIMLKHETDLIARLVNSLNQRRGTDIHAGGYSGFIQFVFVNTQTGKTKRINLWYIHGYGGGGPVTKGTIQSNRRAVYSPDAEIIVTGHIHEEWDLTISRLRINSRGQQYKDEQLHIQLPTYKEEYRDGSKGWHVEGGNPPKPIGAKWLIFKTDSDGKITFDTERAK
jgi:hypothetical protein